MSVTVHHGDCLDVLRGMGEASVDSVVTDPPYGLEFMSVAWDTFSERPKGTARVPNTWGDHGSREHPRNATEQARVMGKKSRAFGQWCEAWAREVYRVMKPGAFAVIFGGTRTYHRMACAVEDAGFEIRDQLSWIYGSGFCKTGYIRDPSTKEIVREGWAGSLKPAHEPIVLARKPLACPTVAANVIEHGTGALNIDGCRVGTGEDRASGGRQGSHAAPMSWGEATGKERPTGARWPANLCHDGSPEVLEAFAAFGGDKGAAAPVLCRAGTHDNIYSPAKGYQGDGSTFYSDTGSAARFFYSAKASKAERAGSKHPTIKPQALLKWLCRLITPPGGLILDPFAGSGSLGEAALAEGFSAVLIEREAEHVADIRRRLGRARGDDAPLFAESAA